MEYTIRQDDVHMSYLPLAHMFERCCEVSVCPDDDDNIFINASFPTN